MDRHCQGKYTPWAQKSATLRKIQVNYSSKGENDETHCPNRYKVIGLFGLSHFENVMYQCMWLLNIHKVTNSKKQKVNHGYYN